MTLSQQFVVMVLACSSPWPASRCLWQVRPLDATQLRY